MKTYKMLCLIFSYDRNIWILRCFEKLPSDALKVSGFVIISEITKIKFDGWYLLTRGLTKS